VKSPAFLIVVAIVQGGLLAALIVLIVLNRWFRIRRSTRLNPRREAVDASMRRWAAGTAPLAGVLVGLARLPVPLAIDTLVKWSARVPGDRFRITQELQHFRDMGTIGVPFLLESFGQIIVPIRKAQSVLP